ncbi:MAG: autotransporter-associated beta strand repeat-containing protein [Thermoguttaceae bacterium]
MLLNAAAGWADPAGVLRKPIPDKLVVLTFDDSPASHATIVAPILKSLGFGGSFYVCDFDSFRTRKDWYMTFRQMKALANDGFEIGNHTRGHYGALNAFLEMEDELAAHDVPKPTTVCWPVYAVNWGACPELTKGGYTFGRGGHERPYRPTVDNPFDVPSFTIRDGVSGETFVNQARQACGGKVVVYTFHGVPDIEHSAVSTEPETFKAMMQYLKDNHYKVIAMRDLAQYVDPAKAVKLPPAGGEVKESGPSRLASEEKPYVAPAAAKSTRKAPAARPPARAAKDNVSAAEPQTPAKSGRPSVFTWGKADDGRWSDNSKWSNNLADCSAFRAAGQSDYVLHFKIPGNHTITNDLQAGFLLNRLDLTPVQGQGITLAGKAIALTANRATGALPSIHEHAIFAHDKIENPLTLASDAAIDVVDAGHLVLEGPISGTGKLIKNGGGTLQINNRTNTYGGGTVINGGKLYVFVANQGLGTGPVTLNPEGNLCLEHVDVTGTPLILNGGTIDADNGFGDSWDGPIVLNGNPEIAAYSGFQLNKTSGGISGPGGFTKIGPQGGFGRVNSGGVSLYGVNTYAGPTVVRQGWLFVKKAVSLYNADRAKWTAANITVHPAATLVISAGGADEFTGEQAGCLLGNLAAAVDNNGLMTRAIFGIDTASAKEPVTVSAIIADSKGPGGGAFTLRKIGAGTLRLTGENTYSGPTIVESGALSVASINGAAGRQAGSLPASGLGAPSCLENGIVEFQGDCTLTYTGNGEVTDRIIDLAGQQQTVTFDQSGSGLLKFTSPFDISGYGFSKKIVLTGSTAGAGELAANIRDPYDRKRAATTSLTKTGSGAWTLSGSNSYTGPTTVSGGRLRLAGVRSLGAKTEISVARGAMLDLNFKGELKVRKLTLGGVVQPTGVYGAEDARKFIEGAGVLKVQP